jgi:plastocyanin
MHLTKTTSSVQVLFRAVATALALSNFSSAQQFVHQVGMVPTTGIWTEGVELADVDHDGDLDIFFASGDGYSTPSTKRQNTLLINNFIPSGVLSFTDESVARLGVHASNAKMVVTRDVNGDGWVDVLFCNAFNTDVPFLYINQGAANPGHFNMESATRGFTVALSSGSAQFGDIDDDGDPDLILNDGYLTTAKKPHLYFNDGTGHFTETPAAISAAVAKSGQMDVQLVDLDNDWDLDFFGACRAANGGVNHYLMLNDGLGTFANAPFNVPSNSASTYEGEVGDLDGDNDIDLFLVSSSGFAEGAIRNNLLPSGPFGMTQITALADGNDDNEIALFDYDNDGDYDVIVGSLSNTSETFWRNNGSMSFTNQSATAITQLTDSTLDLAVGDLNNDGKYDLVTAQGESGTFVNKIYLNTGAADALAPVVTAIDSPASVPSAGPTKVHAKVRDQVMDDSVDYLKGQARYVVRTSISTQTVDIQAAAFVPPVLNVTAGTKVVWTNNAGASRTVTSTTAPFTYDSGALAANATYEHYFVHPGTYNYTSTTGGFVGQVVVSGADTTIASTYSGGGLHRFLMPDAAGGAGVQLVYELVLTDWPGNVRVTDPRSVTLIPACANISIYCTAKVNSLFCQPAIGATGVASASAGSGFSINAINVISQKSGLLFYGLNGPLGSAFQGGFLCVKSPTHRTPIQNSGGTLAGNDCTGTFAFDFNAYIAGGADPLLVQGATVDAQYWSRDPADAFTTNLTNGLEFSICP